MKKGMTLVETMVAICVSTMLLLGLGTSFFMFRIVNTNAIKGVKEESNILSVKDYIINNADEIIASQINGSYFFANGVNELASKYNIYYYDYNYYLVDVNRSHAGTLAQDQEEGKNYEVELSILLNDNNERVITTNGDNIVYFRLPRFENNVPFFIVQYDEYGTEQNIPLNQMSIGDSIYYSGLYKDSEALNKVSAFEYDDTEGKLMALYGNEKQAIFNNLSYDDISIDFSIDSSGYRIYDDTSITLDGSGNAVETTEVITMATYGIRTYSNNPSLGAAVVEEVNDEEEVIMPDANGEYYCSKNITSIDGTYHIGRNESTGAIYLIKTTNTITPKIKVDDNYVSINVYAYKDDNGNVKQTTYGEKIVYFDLPDEYSSSAIYLDQSPSQSNLIFVQLRPLDGNLKYGSALLVAKEAAISGSKLKKTLLEQGKTQDEVNAMNINDTDYWSHPFLGWIEVGASDNKIGDAYTKTDHELYVSIPDEGEIKKYVAVFSDEWKKYTGLNKYLIEDDAKYTNVSKEIYDVKCTIHYAERSFSDSDTEGIVEKRKLTFTVKVYSKYSPELYTGEIKTGE